MLSVGKNIISAQDTLRKIDVDYLYRSLRNPISDIANQVNQLRIIRNLDAKQYTILKRQLPYIVCAMFNPPYRKTENFAYTEYFIIDIDHICDKGFDLLKVKQDICIDERVFMCFVSPSEDGLKVMFKLKERCYDSGIYSLFYKTFLREFSLKYNLEQVIDGRVSDVCRACFISIDEDVFYNPIAQTIDINDYLPIDNPSVLIDLNHSLENEIKESSQPKDELPVDPDAETMQRIKKLLNPKVSKPNKNIPFVPQQLDDIMEDLKKYVEDTGVELYETINIQYGKKLRFKMGLKQAEINLFYGKNGFTVVKSPRTGTSAELNELMLQLINSFIYTNL
jgi:hypothetical protein